MIRAKPWDARLAALLVRPLLGTMVTPNHLTTLRLAVGMGGAWAFASGTRPMLGAGLFALSTFLDHTDGELARTGGSVSKLGHYYDLTSDLLVLIALFVGIGIGLAPAMGPHAIGMGASAGIAIALIFHLRYEIERGSGKSATQQPALAGFEPEDVFYLLPLVVYWPGLVAFLWAAAIGAPLATVIVIGQYRAFMRARLS
jgi:phosphatidylglycerophosphate synthase